MCFINSAPSGDHGLNKEKLFTDMKNLCMKIREGRKRMAKTLVGRNIVSLPTYTCSSLWSGFDIIFLTGSIFIVEVAICLYVIFFYLNLLLVYTPVIIAVFCKAFSIYFQKAAIFTRHFNHVS